MSGLKLRLLAAFAGGAVMVTVSAVSASAFGWFGSNNCGGCAQPPIVYQQPSYGCNPCGQTPTVYAQPSYNVGYNTGCNPCQQQYLPPVQPSCNPCGGQSYYPQQQYYYVNQGPPMPAPMPPVYEQPSYYPTGYENPYPYGASPYSVRPRPVYRSRYVSAPPRPWRRPMILRRYN